LTLREIFLTSSRISAIESMNAYSCLESQSMNVHSCLVPQCKQTNVTVELKA